MPPRRRRDEEEGFNLDIPPVFITKQEMVPMNRKIGNFTMENMTEICYGDFNSLASNFHYFLG